MNLNKETLSLCPQCFKQIPARIVEEDGKIYLKKECPDHGNYNILLEKDAGVYKQLMNPSGKEPGEFQSLMITTTHACNLNCPVCYQPNREVEDIPLEELKSIIAGFPGEVIRFSGGEPTLREDLPELIRFCAGQGKRTTLVTNGVKLVDPIYVRKLKEAGLTLVSLSLAALDDQIYTILNGKKLLKVKLRGLRTMFREQVKVVFSMVVVKGVNESEIKKIYRLYLKKFPRVDHLRIRAAVPIGRHEPLKDQLYLSDLLRIMSQVLNVPSEALMENSLFTRQGRHSPCRLDISLLPLVLKQAGLPFAMDNMTLKQKIKAFAVLWYRFGMKNAFYLSLTKIMGNDIPHLYIAIRCWHDRYRFDAEEIKHCPSGHLMTSGREIIPVCQGFTFNDGHLHL